MSPSVVDREVRYSQGTTPLSFLTELAGATDSLAFWAKTRPRAGESGASKAKTGVVPLEKKWCVESSKLVGSRGARGSSGSGRSYAMLVARPMRSGKSAARQEAL